MGAQIEKEDFMGIRQENVINNLQKEDETFPDYPSLIDAYGVKIFRKGVRQRAKGRTFELLDYMFNLGASAAISLSAEEDVRDKDKERFHRLAIGSINSAAQLPGLSKQGKEDTDDILRNPGKYTPDAVQITMHISDFQLFTLRFLEGLKKATFSAEDARSELRDAAKKRREKLERRRILEGEWTRLLAPEPKGRTGKSGIRENSVTEKDPLVHKERIENLLDIVTAWGEGHVEEAKFGKSSNNKYYAAVLPVTDEAGEPKKHPNGESIVHVIIDNPREGAGAYVWRHLDQEKVWQEVFDERYRSEAKRDGAVMVAHREDTKIHWKDKILDLLTCDDEVYRQVITEQNQKLPERVIFSQSDNQ